MCVGKFVLGVSEFLCVCVWVRVGWYGISLPLITNRCVSVQHYISINIICVYIILVEFLVDYNFRSASKYIPTRYTVMLQ